MISHLIQVWIRVNSLPSLFTPVLLEPTDFKISVAGVKKNCVKRGCSKERVRARMVLEGRVEPVPFWEYTGWSQGLTQHHCWWQREISQGLIGLKLCLLTALVMLGSDEIYGRSEIRRDGDTVFEIFQKYGVPIYVTRIFVLSFLRDEYESVSYYLQSTCNYSLSSTPTPFSGVFSRAAGGDH